MFGGYAAMFLPWFVVGRTQFIWYMLPAVPFMCLAVSTTLRRMPAILGRNAAILLAGATVVVALLFLPAVDRVARRQPWIRAASGGFPTGRSEIHVLAGASEARNGSPNERGGPRRAASFVQEPRYCEA